MTRLIPTRFKANKQSNLGKDVSFASVESSTSPSPLKKLAKTVVVASPLPAVVPSSVADSADEDGDGDVADVGSGDVGEGGAFGGGGGGGGFSTRIGTHDEKSGRRVRNFLIIEKQVNSI